MGIQSFVPSSGGGMPGASFIGSIQMVTYNRSWTQAGGPGDYALVSNKLSNGYAYFVSGGTTLGVPLGNVINLPNGFTRIDVVAPKDDYIMLYKVATKTTAVFNNAFANFSSFPSQISSSGNFVLPNSALPLVNVLIVGGGGGGGGSHHGGGGGGGGGIVKLTAFQAVGTTSVTIGGGGGTRSQGGTTYFGNVYAIGGGGGGNHSSGATGGTGANGGGAGSHHINSGGSGSVQTVSSGLGNFGSPEYVGGYAGGAATWTNSSDQQRGGGGGGGGGVGEAATGNQSGGHGGHGHDSDISGSHLSYSAGGYGSSHNGQAGYRSNYSTSFGRGGFSGRWNHHEGGHGGDNGGVIVRYYIP